MKKSRKLLKNILIVFLIIVICVILIAAITFISIYNSAKLDANAVISKKNNIIMYSLNNDEIKNEKLARYVKYENINQNIINAFVSLEDKRFYKHKGVDYYRTTGAALHNLKAGYTKEGGSTITQQLAKNTHLSNEKTLVRKIKEMKLATDIEKKYSKEQILEFYLNAIYFGNGIYGIDSACKNYFNKEPNEINVAEAAYLAGIVKNPSKYSPKNNPEKADERKNLVIKLMKEQGYIDEKEYENAKNKNYNENYNNTDTQPDILKPYYSNALSEASIILGISEKEVLENGYKVYTFYSESEQKILANAFESGQFDGETKGGGTADSAAMLSNNLYAGITAYYSNFAQSQYNFKRQPASTIKPILSYAAAVELKKYSPLSIVNDSEIIFNDYSPKNYGGIYYGDITLKESLMHSSNSVSVQLLNEVGIENGKKIAQKMGIDFGKSDNGLSLALGGMENGVHFHQLNSAYMTFANNGKYTENSFIRMIYDKNGAIVYRKNIEYTQAISPESAYLITDMLCSNAKSGTAKKLSIIDGEIAAKTGTNVSSYDYKYNFDSWCVSYTPLNTLCVWYGDLKNSEENSIKTTGGNYPALLSQYIHKSLNNTERIVFTKPDGIIELSIDKYALTQDGKLYLSNPHTPEELILKGLFNAETAPIDFSPYFDLSSINLQAVSDSQSVEISFNKAEPYTIKLLRQNIFNGEIVEIPFEASESDTITIIDENFEEFTPYEYSLELSYQNKVITYKPRYVVFT